MSKNTTTKDSIVYTDLSGKSFTGVEFLDAVSSLRDFDRRDEVIERLGGMLEKAAEEMDAPELYDTMTQFILGYVYSMERSGINRTFMCLTLCGLLARFAEEDGLP